MFHDFTLIKLLWNANSSENLLKLPRLLKLFLHIEVSTYCTQRHCTQEEQKEKVTAERKKVHSEKNKRTKPIKKYKQRRKTFYQMRMAKFTVYEGGEKAKVTKLKRNEA